MGKHPQPSNTRTTPASLFDILRFTTIRMTRWDRSRWQNDQIYAVSQLAIAWRPDELRRYHDALGRQP